MIGEKQCFGCGVSVEFSCTCTSRYANEWACLGCRTCTICDDCQVKERQPINYRDLAEICNRLEFSSKAVVEYRGTQVAIPQFPKDRLELTCRGTCPTCRQSWTDCLVEILFDHGVIDRPVFEELLERCYRCVIDYLLYPSEDCDMIWAAWQLDGKESNLLQWLPEEVLSDIIDLDFREYHPIGTFEKNRLY